MNGCELGHHLQGAAHSFPLVLQDQLYRTWALKPPPPQLQTADKRQSSWLQNSPAQQGLVPSLWQLLDSGPPSFQNLT